MVGKYFSISETFSRDFNDISSTSTERQRLLQQQQRQQQKTRPGRTRLAKFLAYSLRVVVLFFDVGPAGGARDVKLADGPLLEPRERNY